MPSLSIYLMIFQMFRALDIPFSFKPNVPYKCYVEEWPEKLWNKTIYAMVNFYFKLSKAFPIVKNGCLQHVNISTEKYLLNNYKSSKL